MQRPLTFGVVGYSTRSLVQAIVDLGHRVIAFDAFGDQDTLELAAAVHVIDDWPMGIERAIGVEPMDAWLLGGGMENCQALLQQLGESTSRSLAGSAPVFGPTLEQMQTLRSLEFLESVCDNEIVWPTTTFTRPLDGLSGWVTKPLHSAGGLFVRAAHTAHDDAVAPAAMMPATHYWQRRIDGRVLGATWIFDHDDCELHGLTQSLTEDEWPGPSQFIYRGSIGPIDLHEGQLAALTALGQRVRAALPDYRGYLQADLIEDRSGLLWLLEFNPRWTAGMEVLHESAQAPHESPLCRHLQAWNIGPVTCEAWHKPRTRLVSKAVYYSAGDIELSQAARHNLQGLRRWHSGGQEGVQWCVADLPAVAPPAPMRFPAGSPILTLKSRLLTIN